MKTVYKYTIASSERITEVLLPIDSQLLHVDMQGGLPTLWALVDTDLPLKVRKFTLFGTGHDITSDVQHVGTIMDAPYVWHVFEIR